MSYLHPDPLPARQKIGAFLAILLMVPVLLDGFGLIDLGNFIIAPFMLLLAFSGIVDKKPPVNENGWVDLTTDQPD